MLQHDCSDERLQKIIPIMIRAFYEISDNPIWIENQVVAQVGYNQRMKILICCLFIHIFLLRKITRYEEEQRYMKLGDKAYRKTASYLWYMPKYHKGDGQGLSPVNPV